MDGSEWYGDEVWPFTSSAYASAIEALRLAATQPQPDGKECAICGDTDHQAFECRFNPLVMAARAVRRETEWRCFHCNEVFSVESDAREHFGKGDFEVAACCARTDADTITAIVEAVRDEDDDEQAETLVRHLLRGVGCEEDSEVEELV